MHPQKGTMTQFVLPRTNMQACTRARPRRAPQARPSTRPEPSRSVVLSGANLVETICALTFCPKAPWHMACAVPDPPFRRSNAWTVGGSRRRSSRPATWKNGPATAREGKELLKVVRVFVPLGGSNFLMKSFCAGRFQVLLGEIIGGLKDKFHSVQL